MAEGLLKQLFIYLWRNPFWAGEAEGYKSEWNLWDLLEYTKLYEFSNHILISEDRDKDEDHAQLPDHQLCSFVKKKLRVGRTHI